MEDDELLPFFGWACVIAPIAALTLAILSSPKIDHENAFNQLLAVASLMGAMFSILVLYTTACAIVYRALKLLGMAANGYKR